MQSCEVYVLGGGGLTIRNQGLSSLAKHEPATQSLHNPTQNVVIAIPLSNLGRHFDIKSALVLINMRYCFIVAVPAVPLLHGLLHQHMFSDGRTEAPILGSVSSQNSYYQVTALHNAARGPVLVKGQQFNHKSAAGIVQ